MNTFTFLLVDDDKEFIEVTAQRLRQRGFPVYCASSGTDALEQLAVNDAVDTVVLDVKMPRYDGIMTVRALKERYPLIEVIMLTAHDDVPAAIQAMKHGAFDYLSKPCEMDVLLAKAARAAARKRKREAEILNIRTLPYISDRERERLIADVIHDKNVLS